MGEVPGGELLQQLVQHHVREQVGEGDEDVRRRRVPLRVLRVGLGQLVRREAGDLAREAGGEALQLLLVWLRGVRDDLGDGAEELDAVGLGHLR